MDMPWGLVGRIHATEADSAFVLKLLLILMSHKSDAGLFICTFMCSKMCSFLGNTDELGAKCIRKCFV